MKKVYRGVRALGDLSGSLLLIATVVGLGLHLLHGVWAMVPDVLPVTWLPN